jgi:hypothetical protein
VFFSSPSIGYVEKAFSELVDHLMELGSLRAIMTLNEVFRFSTENRTEPRKA